MLIPNIGSAVQALQPAKHANDRPATNNVAADVAHASPAVESPKITAPQQISPEQLKSAVHSINQALHQSGQSSLEFTVDTSSKKLIVRMVDAGTGELIRQIPSEAVLAIASSIDEYLVKHEFQHGQLLTQKA